MQLLETGATRKLLEVLQDIVHQVEIKPDFAIHHPGYKPLELSVEMVERFQTMPTQIQHKYLSLQLRNFIYGIYYNASMHSTLALDGKGSSLPLDLENNTVLGIDLGFYEQLHESNCGAGYFDPGWTVIREEADGSLAVTKGALRLHIHKEKHLQSTKRSAVIGDQVAIKLPKNRLQNGFYMAVSNHGFGRLEHSKHQPITVRIYFNLTPPGAVVVMKNLTQQLNNLAIPFSFKVLYNPQDYGRYDSGVLYFDKEYYEVVKEVLQVVYAENKLHFLREVPLFTLQLAPGLGLAEEPNQKFSEQESFGMNRCQIVANGLLKAWYQGDNSIDGKMQSIYKQFSNLGIDLQRVYLNSGSEDIYKFLMYQ
jgi:hypothetical protein